MKIKNVPEVYCTDTKKMVPITEMKFHAIQETDDSWTYDLAMYNCKCKSTHTLRIPKQKRKAA